MEPGKAIHEVRGKECGRGEDEKFRLKFGVAGEDAEAPFRFHNAMSHFVGANIFSDALEKAAGNPTVSLGPGERAFLLSLTRRKIVDAGPGGSVFRKRAVIVAAGVIHVPVHKTRITALLLKPVGKGEAIQILELEGAPKFERNCKLPCRTEF